MMQGRGGQQFQADDGAGKGHHGAEQQGLQRRVAKTEADHHTEQDKGGRAAERDHGGLAQHAPKLLRQ